MDRSERKAKFNEEKLQAENRRIEKQEQALLKRNRDAEKIRADQK